MPHKPTCGKCGQEFENGSQLEVHRYEHMKNGVREYFKLLFKAQAEINKARKGE